MLNLGPSVKKLLAKPDLLSPVWTELFAQFQDTFTKPPLTLTHSSSYPDKYPARTKTIHFAAPPSPPSPKHSLLFLITALQCSAYFQVHVEREWARRVGRERRMEREKERSLIGLNIMPLMDRCLRPTVIRREGGISVYRSTSVSVKGVCFLSQGGDAGIG